VLDLPRAMASALGVSKATVQRVWSHNKIKPHLTRVLKLSTDPDFEAKFWDVIGLYLNPSSRQWCSVMTKKVRSRLFGAGNRVCRWAEGISAPKPTITMCSGPRT